jgi:hypothetical protein
MDTTPFSGARRRLAGLALAAALLGAAATPAAAAVASGSIYAGGLNTPGGTVWLGSHLWATDHVNGLCRLDPADPALKLPAGSLAPNAATCVLPGGGQPSFDAVHNVVYAPDDSTQGNSVLRYAFNPTTETLRPSAALGSNVIPAGSKPTATALAPDGSLYVSFIKSANIVRIDNPSGVDAAGNPVTPVATVIGTTSDGRKGAASLTFANRSDGKLGTSLYLAEGGDITEIPDPASCSTAAPCAFGTVRAPQATNMLASTVINGKAVVWEGLDVTVDPANPDVVYLAKWAPHDLGNTVIIDRRTLSTAAQIQYATAYTAPDGKLQPFTSVTDLAPNPAGGLFVAHDPTNGGTNGALISRLP